MARLILLVEDDPMVASMLMAAMRSWGVDALHAANAKAAVAYAETYQDRIGMMICDVLLPGESGPVIAAQVRSICPDVKTCFTSGYTPDILTQRGILPSDILNDTSVTYLQKPFLPRTIHDMIVREIEDPEAGLDATREKGVLYGTAC
jgi:DNA-binding response OmpR family regulator